MTGEPTRRERERARHRAEILAAAEQLLVDRGLERTTMEDIARQSEFAVGSLYRFFASKEDLVEALVVARTQEYARRVAELAEAAPSYLDALDQMLELHASEVKRSFPLIQFLLSGKHRWIPLSSPSDAPEAPVNPLQHCMADVVVAAAGLLERGRREGVLDGDPHTMAVVLLALLDGFSRHTLISGDLDLRPQLGVIRAAFHDGFRRRA